VIDNLISKLDKPKRTGSGSWIARCPAHDDRSPSLTVREMPDGRILLKCHAECDTQAVLDAMGLKFSDLFPEPLGERLPPVRRPFPAADVLETVMHDALLVQQIAIEVQRTAKVTPEQRALLAKVAAHISAARDLVNG
jgi:hypothetical protein